MLPPTLEYLAPTTLGAAVEALATLPNARFTAGSYRLLIDLKMRRIDVGTLIDLRRLSELRLIADVDGALQIGALVSLDALAADERVRARFPALAQAAAQTGDAQIRNMAAIGGTLAYDGSASDIAAALLVLDADIHTHSIHGQRVISAGDFFTPDGGTALRADEIITMVALSTAEARSAYAKFTHPAALSAIIGVAAALTVHPDGAAARCALAVSGTVVRAQRLAAAESALTGAALDAAAIQRAAARAADGVIWQPDSAASSEYRSHRLRVMVARALTGLA